ncbi:Mur ligase [Pholiota conissans]|uniref:Mur ligase n=1 Tax=Pholiota conissans TaxID=109636 RepID=A0A9P5Z1Y4_9AGAR|nr:Mur ligase [Pholiota conissans]
MSIDLGLDRLERLVSHLPSYTRPTIHIAGTNGKGSVSALLTSILLSSRPPFRVGRYNSPHLITILDCITIDNVPASHSFYDEIRREVEEADQKHGTHLSSFELLTMTALLAFERSGVDIVILEVGMGGRLDATNIVPTSCILASVLTAVDLDHQAFLGNTITEIAKEKAGISREGKPFILGRQAHPEVDEVVKGVLEKTGGLLVPSVSVEKVPDEDSVFSLLGPSQSIPGGQLVSALLPSFSSSTPLRASLSLQGAHQRDNLATALTVIDTLLQNSALPFKSRITLESIEEGVSSVSWPGRLSFHKISIKADGSNDIDKTLVLADGAHNPASAETLGAYIESLLESTLKSLPSSNQSPKPLPITFVLALSHSPPKTPLQTLGPLFRPVQSSAATSILNIHPAVAVLSFTPPEGMPWVKSVPASAMRGVVSSLLPSLTEDDIWVPSSPEHAAEGGGLSQDLEEALRWAAKRHSVLGGYWDDGEQVSGLVVLAGSLYLVADFYRLIEGGILG